MIRDGIKNDAEQIAKLKIRNYRKTYNNIFSNQFLNKMNLEDEKQKYINGLKNRKVLVYYDEDKVLGYIYYGKRKNHKEVLPDYDGEIYAIYVDVDFQKKGIGKKLIIAALNDLIKDYNKIILWCMKDNYDSLQFYKKINFTELESILTELGGKELYETGLGYDFKKNETAQYRKLSFSKKDKDRQINRISIIGGSGSGKSTLANILSNALNIPTIHLDSINYKANWVQIDGNERDKIISSKANEDKWIIDGNYNKTLKERLNRADMIIWLDYSTFAHLKGVCKRIVKNYNKEKPDIPGCKERINYAFLKYVVTYNKKERPKVLDLLKDISDEKILIFKRQKDLNKWLKNYYTNGKNVLDYIK